MNVIVTPAPHIRSEQSVQNVMLNVLIALIPTTLAGVFFFGPPALAVIITSVLSALAVEAFINWIKKEPLTITDGSAAVTGLLLALVLPPVLPIWMVIIGNIVAIGITKHFFGGLGHNIFNPALAARLFLAVSYPVAMTTWYKAGAWFQHLPITTATPLSKGSGMVFSNFQLFMGNVPGSIGETSAFAIILGAAWLFHKKIIDWKIPATFLGMIFLVALLAKQDPFFHVFAGGAMIGAFFMLTDYVTSPITKIGRIIYGLMTGILVMTIRLWSHMPEGVAFSIVLMNGFVPLFDKLGIFLHISIYERLFRIKK
ncbi:MAG: RnfABCDGE type electron transport complex subunit D [Candidatus Margulisbacteria bacterium]|nr:RnfABCDGE type electron transport complex subunit D [Candidatus Margulisiibacteriota bacterium]